MRVLSLFDGCAGAYQALKEVDIPVEAYYASEIDRYAKQVALKNHPDIIQLGDIRTFGDWLLPIEGGFDLIIGGSPCQDLSIAKQDRKGLLGERSGLFWLMANILRMRKPKYFLVENVVSMNKESRDTISKALGVEPIMINSALLTAQQRKRLYWTNIPNVTQPEDAGIVLEDILEEGYMEEKYYKKGGHRRYSKKPNTCITTSEPIRIGDFGNISQGARLYATTGKSVTLLVGGNSKNGWYETPFGARKLTPVECERLQGFPDGYTSGVSNTQRYKMLGNAFTVAVVAHILKQIKE